MPRLPSGRLKGATARRASALVLRIYELYAAGTGLPTIAHTLNADGAPSPSARRGGANGWCPASVREILKRPLYRGEIVYGRSKKRDKEGKINPTKLPPSQWLRISAPDLRIVPEELATAVDARRDSMRKRSLRLSNGSLLGRPPGEGSPYLLTGLLSCGVCGGGMEVLSSKSGGRRTFHYRCYVARRKGPACCTNKLAAPMADADAAVVRAVKDTLMHPAVIERALACAEAELLRDRTAERRQAIEMDLAEAEKAMRRLTAAIAKGGELEPLMAGLQTQERQRAELRARLTALDAEPRREAIDPATVRQQLKNYLKDWQGLLLGHVGQAQQVLRRLVVGRLTLTPQEDGVYAFSGKGTVRPLLGGAIRNVASPGGHAHSYAIRNVASPTIPSWNQMRAFLEDMGRLRELGFSAA